MGQQQVVAVATETALHHTSAQSIYDDLRSTTLQRQAAACGRHVAAFDTCQRPASPTVRTDRLSDATFGRIGSDCHRKGCCAAHCPGHHRVVADAVATQYCPVPRSRSPQATSSSSGGSYEGQGGAACRAHAPVGGPAHNTVCFFFLRCAQTISTTQQGAPARKPATHSTVSTATGSQKTANGASAGAPAAAARWADRLPDHQHPPHHQCAQHWSKHKSNAATPCRRSRLPCASWTCSEGSRYMWRRGGCCVYVLRSLILPQDKGRWWLMEAMYTKGRNRAPTAVKLGICRRYTVLIRPSGGHVRRRLAWSRACTASNSASLTSCAGRPPFSFAAALGAYLAIRLSSALFCSACFPRMAATSACCDWSPCCLRRLASGFLGRLLACTPLRHVAYAAVDVSAPRALSRCAFSYKCMPSRHSLVYHMVALLGTAFGHNCWSYLAQWPRRWHP